jgi:predicted metalloprotease with PDZ domain
MNNTSRRVSVIGACATVLALLSGDTGVAQSLEPIQYVLRLPAPATHYIDVEARVPTSRKPVVDLMMAVWTPGSYLVREFARHVEELRVRDDSGRTLTVEKTRKNRWRVQTDGAGWIVLTYRVYANEHQARTNWVEPSFALINGASTFITLAENAKRPSDVLLHLPPDWSTSLTSLPALGDARSHRYRAPDFDALVDSPIVAGNPAVYRFTVDGVPHALVNIGEAGVGDAARSARDVERIVGAAHELWKVLPYERFLFFNLLIDRESNDGIEHKGSTVLIASRWATRTETAYRAWLGLVAHEFFHAWNVKRLRPIELGPFDYENEVYTRSLWIAEGLSDYYYWLLVRRAGLFTRDQTLAKMSAATSDLQSTPGRLVQSLEAASFDAWIKQYLPDENTLNDSVSYYTKGSVVGLLLDARIRRVTNGARSLDDVMRLAYQRFSGSRGYTPAEFRAVANEVAGTDLAEFFHHALETAQELDYADVLDWYGLRFEAMTDKPSANAWLGALAQSDGGRLIVSGVLRDSPAYLAGVSAGDELLAIDDFRLGAGGLDAALRRYRSGEKVTILVSRRDQLSRLEVTLANVPAALEARSSTRCYARADRASRGVVGEVISS